LSNARHRPAHPCASHWWLWPELDTDQAQKKEDTGSILKHAKYAMAHASQGQRNWLGLNK